MARAIDQYLDRIPQDLRAMSEVPYEVRQLAEARRAAQTAAEVDSRNRVARNFDACPHLGYSSGGAQTSATTCLRDGIHKTTLGNAVGTQPLIEVLTASAGTGDGVCSGGACTAGIKKAACSANADCDTWHSPTTW